MHKLLGLTDDDELSRLRNAGEIAIQDEFDAYACKDEDENGWTDLDWLKYLRNEKAAETSVREGAEGTMADDVIDRGLNGMTLDAFVQHPAAVAAGLKRVHVLALRLYSSSVHRNINKPLHDGCSPTRPHPYPALVAVLAEAIKKVRTEQIAMGHSPHSVWVTPP